MTQSLKAHRLPTHAGPAAWNAILGAQPPAQSLDRDETADFVIVGGGFAGLSAARRLLQLQPKAKIAVLEAGRFAEAASGRNSGFMIDLPHDLASDDYAGQGPNSDRVLIELNRNAIAFARQAVDEYEIDPNYFDEVGKVNGAASQTGHNHNLSYAKHLRSLGEQSEMLDGQQMHELTGSRHYHSGLYTPGTVMLQPAGYIRGLVSGLSDRVSLYENTPATEFRRIGPDWQVITPKGSITTGRILLTNNGHLESFGFEKGRLMQLFLYASMTSELDSDTLRKLGGQPRWGVTPSDPMGTTMRRIDVGQGGNRIITRTCATMKLNMKPTQAGVARAAKVQQRKFNQRFPQLAGMEMEYKWAGHLCLALNGVSVLREVEDGVFAGCVQNGLGTARGTLTGIGAAELACGEQSDITDYFTQEARPKRLPSAPIAEIGANAVLRWKEWRAGNE
ncbi:NAD(P)/FAD-dependent oxidoreductase [Cochlodiniinecator piscidefendens]|uniref:NAD(P)/FAD-dependent oxidoreductase n=1 Tax=Cochlodiniinecator piscidefendens TaxID=2715756 RepID=UPI0014085882|nr:FAD-binding oxidoreductase [Cochlodiniinecator piscidefendens]